MLSTSSTSICKIANWSVALDLWDSWSFSVYSRLMYYVNQWKKAGSESVLQEIRHLSVD